jgi:hypothetical protein
MPLVLLLHYRDECVGSRARLASGSALWKFFDLLQTATDDVLYRLWCTAPVEIRLLREEACYIFVRSLLDYIFRFN